MLFAELMVQTAMTVAPPRVCVLIAGLSWVPWLLCTPGVQPHPARVQSVWLRPGEAVNQPSAAHTLHIHPPHIPNTKLRVTIPTKKLDSFKGCHTKKINTSPQIPLPPHLPSVTRQPHPPPPSRRPEAWDCCFSWRRCLWASWLQGLAGWARRRPDSWAAEVVPRRAWNSL